MAMRIRPQTVDPAIERSGLDGEDARPERALLDRLAESSVQSAARAVLRSRRLRLVPPIVVGGAHTGCP